MSERPDPQAGTPARSRNAKVWAALFASWLGIPLLVLFGFSMADGERRAQETPLRAVIGNARFEALMAGEGGNPHYLGYERLAPDITLTDRNGEEWRLADHRGKVIVMNFWSITCGPCVEEMPTLELLAEMIDARFGGDVELVAVSTDADWDAVSSILPEEPRLAHYFDPDKEVVEGAFGTQLYPETWIIDAEGVIRFRYDGARDWSSPLMLDLIALFL